MDKSAEGPWRIVTHKPMQDCPLENCGGNVKQYKGCKTPIPFYTCTNRRCDFATWTIWSDSPERRNNVKKLTKIHFEPFYKKVKRQEKYWAYVLKTDHHKPYYYVGATSHHPRYRLLQHSIPEHQYNSGALMKVLREDRNGNINSRNSPWLIKIIGPFNTRLESLYAESILHMAYEKQYGQKFVLGDITEKIVPWEELDHQPPKELREHLRESENLILSTRLKLL